MRIANDYYGACSRGARAVLPGVTTAGSDWPPHGLRGDLPVQLEGRRGPAIRRDERLLDTCLRASRDTTPSYLCVSDGRAAGRLQDRPYVAIVSESSAAILARQDPSASCFRFAMKERIVVGVVGDTRSRARCTSDSVLPAVSVHPTTTAIATCRRARIRSTLPSASGCRRAPHRRGGGSEQPSRTQTLAEVVAGETAARRVQLRCSRCFRVASRDAVVGIHGLLSFACRSDPESAFAARGAQADRSWDGASRGMCWPRRNVIGLGVALGGRARDGRLLYGVPSVDRSLASAAGLCRLVAVIGCVRTAVQPASHPMTALLEAVRTQRKPLGALRTRGVTAASGLPPGPVLPIPGEFIAGEVERQRHRTLCTLDEVMSYP